MFEREIKCPKDQDKFIYKIKFPKNVHLLFLLQ